MCAMPAPGERYLLRRKVLTLMRASFLVYDERGNLAAFCRKKAFRLREDIRIYADMEQRDELMTLRARQIIDFGATYDLALPDGTHLGAFRRKGLKSSFVRDEWLVYDEQDRHIATLRETGSLAFLRKYSDWLLFLVAQRYELRAEGDGRLIASYRQRFNPFIYTLGVRIQGKHDVIDDLFVLAMACLLGTIEGRER